MPHIHIKKIVEYSIALLFIGLVLYLGNRIGYEPIIEFIKTHLLLGLFIYFIYSIVSNVIIFLPLVPLWPIVVYFYGFNLSVVTTIVGTVIGASICFSLGRVFGKKFVIRTMGKHLFREVERLSKFDSLKNFTLVRLLGNNYYDLISYVAGLSKLSYLTYMLITAATTCIWTVALFYIIQISGGLKNMGSFIGLMTAYAVIVLLATLVWEIYHKKHHSPHNRNNS